jgi:hypothetical protein
MDAVEYERLMKQAVPHGPNQPCTCAGCHACAGHVKGCTCDIDWDAAAELRQEWRHG